MKRFRNLYPIRPVILLAVIFTFFSCIDSISPKIKTDTKLIIPIAFAEYKIKDLFYDYPDTAVVEHGVFYSIRDTIPLRTQLNLYDPEKIAFQFQSVNYLPVHVDLKLTPFDTINRNTLGESFQTRMAESAFYNEQVELLTPVYSDSVLCLSKRDTLFRLGGGALIQFDFIWPREQVEVVIDDEIPAFSLNVILYLEY